MGYLTQTVIKIVNIDILHTLCCRSLDPWGHYEEGHIYLCTYVRSQKYGFGLDLDP